MVKVENKETLRLLTSRFMKMNRARNIIAVIAIMLTSLLFTSLFCGECIHDSFQKSNGNQTIYGFRPC